MHSIRILQISDILAGSPAISPGDIFDELTSWVNENSPHDRIDKVDYIVVCGNVTVDGKPESFEVARKLLHKLGNELLEKDPLPNERSKKETRFNRMLVVPGRTDVPIRAGENSRPESIGHDPANLSLYPDFQPFKDFHDQLFAEELNGRVSAFDFNSAICRPLKDITLIGGSYWDVENGDLREKLLQRFESEIKGAKQQLSELEYVKYSPKILISAGYPLYRWDVQDIYTRIRRFLRDELIISLHLFGSGSIVGVLPEPYSLPHVGLGTGPRSPEGFWPFRANLIEMCVGAEKAGRPDTPLISNYVFQRLPHDTRFVRRDHIRGHLDLFLNRRQEVPPQGSVFDSFLKQIETTIFDDEKTFILISGLPGSGKRELFKHLKQQSKLGKHDVQVASVILENYDIKTLKTMMEKVEAKIFGEPQPSDSPEVIRLEHRQDVILIVRDLYYHHLDNRKSEVMEFLNSEETISRLFMIDDGRPKVRAVLYLVSGAEADTKLDVRIPSYKKQTLVLAPLGIEAINLLVKQYSRDAPVIEFDLDNVTGGYAGFSRLLLDATKEAFGYVVGAEPISCATSARLMGQALGSNQKLKDEADLYLSAIESRHGGAMVSQFIQSEIRKIQKKAQKEGEDLSRNLKPLNVSVSVRKLKKAMKNPTERQGLQITLDQFVNMGILVKDDSNTDLYKVRTIMPFLIGSTQPPPPPDGVPITPEVTPMNTTKVDFLIVTALGQERDAVLELLPGAQRLDPSEDIYTYHSAKVPVKTAQGTVGSYNVIVMSYPSMGRVQASAATANAIHRWKPDCVLLVGIAGGFANRGVKIGDILIANQIIDYSLQKLRENDEEIRFKAYQTDEQLRIFADHLKKGEYEPLLPKTRPGEGAPEVLFGDIASGDKVDARGEIFMKFGKTWPNMIGVEMEAGGAAVAALQAAYKPKFFMVRGVSDLADREKDTTQVGNWRQYACDVAAAYALALLKSGPLRLTSNVEALPGKVEGKPKDFARATPAAGAGDMQRTDRAPRSKQELLSSGDITTLADLLDRSGKAELESRGTLCVYINVDPNDLYFLRIPKNIDFAVQLITLLQRTGNTKALLALCDILAKGLQGDYAVQLDEIRSKLEEPVVAR